MNFISIPPQSIGIPVGAAAAAAATSVAYTAITSASRVG